MGSTLTRSQLSALDLSSHCDIFRALPTAIGKVLSRRLPLVAYTLVSNLLPFHGVGPVITGGSSQSGRDKGENDDVFHVEKSC
jgi:hypothetical protein